MRGLKQMHKVRILILAAAFVVFGLTGCASVNGIKPGDSGAAALENADDAWWYASFHINWPQDQDPSMDTDLLIAHRIISPVLERYKNRIVLWRFHRRAARDEAGHRFSFIFYADAATAREIYAAIDSSSVLARLKTRGVVVRVKYDDTAAVKRAGIEATSDPVGLPSFRRRGRISSWASAGHGST